jgi:prevent-host-death family protein
MVTSTIRQLACAVSATIDRVHESGEPVLVTRRGEPVAVILPVDLEALGEHLKDTAPEYVRKAR